MTCPHCASSTSRARQPLIDEYVKTGRVSFEFRNFVRDAFDLTASLIARCNGAKSFFPLTGALFKDQPQLGRQAPGGAAGAARRRCRDLPPDQQFVEFAKLAGFQQWAAQRGVPSAKSSSAWPTRTTINQLVQMNSDATTQYPEFAGTPTFVLNGKLLEQDVANWETLEPQLARRLGS